MRQDLAGLLVLVGLAALVGYRYSYNTTTFLERRWFYRFKDRTSPAPRYGLDGLASALTLPDSQEHRKKRVANVCQRYGSRLSRPHSRNQQKSNFYPDTGRHRFCSTFDCPLLVDLSRKFMFCFVQKVASSSMKALLLANASSTVNLTAFHRVANDQIRRVGPRFFSAKQLKTFYKAMFVRHPFERLVSVYEDKVGRELEQVAFFYEKYFKAFAARKNITGTLSFSDFVDYLIETPWAEFDEHWMPYFHRCEVCLVDYDFIGKLETAAEDFDAMLTKTKALADLKPNLRRLNAHQGTEDFGRVEMYFIQLERNQIMALYRIYRFDFELFGYNILNYIDTIDNVIF